MKDYDVEIFDVLYLDEATSMSEFLDGLEKNKVIEIAESIY